MIDDKGMAVPDNDDLVAQMSDTVKAKYGEDTKTDEASAFGIIIRLFSWFQAILYQDIEASYFAGFIDTATGVSLDRLASNYGLHRNPAVAATVKLRFTGEPGYTITEPMTYGTKDGVDFELYDNVNLVDDGTGTGRGTGWAAAVDTGPDSNVGAGTITVPVDDVAQVESVTNDASASGGVDVETDTSLRNRIHLQVTSQPGPTLSGIYTALYNVAGVKRVQIVSNLTMETDDQGNPPKSLHIYVLGGTQQAVAAAILDSIGAGVQTVGGISLQVDDIGGHPHQISFDTATEVALHASVTIQTADDFDPTNGPDAIKQGITNYVESVEMGGKVVYTKLFQAIYNVPGIASATVKLGKSADSLGASDIQLDEFETVVMADGGIEVVVDGQ